MKIIENKQERIIIRMDANEPLANAIRRSVPEVPTLAIDEVEIFKNDSALYDEILAHRFGLVPLKTEKGMNEKTKLELKLSKKGPCTVYAGDFKGSAEVVHAKIPITILSEDHKLELVATAILGKGTEHSKYTPGLCFYRHILEIKSSPKVDQIISKSRGLIKPEKEGNKWICDISENDEEEISKIDKTAISNSSELLLVIESFGQMHAKDILVKAMKVLSDNLDAFEKEVK